MLSKLDESVGKVVEALQIRGLLENSIIIFTTDNGGPAAGFNDNSASNYPLRGVSIYSLHNFFLIISLSYFFFFKIQIWFSVSAEQSHCIS